METNETRFRRSELNLLRDIFYYYDQTHYEYNRNMGNLISLVRMYMERHRTDERRNYMNRNFDRRYRSNSSPLSPLFSYMNYPLDNSLPGLTEQQINSATEILPFNTEMRDTQCPISFEEFVEGEDILKIRFCGHIFKTDAIRNWFLRNRRCPVCRHDLSTTPVPIREINIDLSFNRLPSLHSSSFVEETIPQSNNNDNSIRNLFGEQSMNDIENNLVDNLTRIFQNITFPPVENQQNDILSRYVFEFPIYFDVSNNITNTRERI